MTGVDFGTIWSKISRRVCHMRLCASGWAEIAERGKVGAGMARVSSETAAGLCIAAREGIASEKERECAAFGGGIDWGRVSVRVAAS